MFEFRIFSGSKFDRRRTKMHVGRRLSCCNEENIKVLGLQSGVGGNLLCPQLTHKALIHRGAQFEVDALWNVHQQQARGSHLPPVDFAHVAVLAVCPSVINASHSQTVQNIEVSCFALQYTTVRFCSLELSGSSQNECVTDRHRLSTAKI